MNKLNILNMKKILIYALALAAVLNGCSKTVLPVGEGSLTIGSVVAESDMIEISTKAADGINTDDFDITIKSTETDYTKTEKFSAIKNKSISLTPGKYIVTAESPDKEPAAWDQPILSGSKEVEIIAGEASSATIKCSVSNMKVTISVDESVEIELASYNVTVSNNTAFGISQLTWGKEDIAAAKAGWFTVGPLTVVVDGLRSIDGSPVKFEKIIENVGPAEHHIINLVATVTGKLDGIQITIDDSLDERDENIEIDGVEETPIPGDPTDPEEPENPDTPSTVPSLEWAANPEFKNMDISEDMDVNLTVKAPEKIASFIIYVKSDVLSPTIAALCANTVLPENGIATMDMLNDTVLIENLNGMGLGIPTGDSLKDKTEVDFSLSKLVPMINVYSPEPGSVHAFTLEITDAKGQKFSKTLNFVSPAN